MLAGAIAGLILALILSLLPAPKDTPPVRINTARVAAIAVCLFGAGIALILWLAKH